MSHKNVIFWPAIKNEKLSGKYGGFDYFEYSKKTWEFWCDKNNCLFVEFSDPVESDLFRYRPNWQKSIFVFDELDRRGINYDQIALMDSTTMPKWDCPNFFDLTKNKFTAWRDSDGIDWITDSVEGYKSFFDNFELKTYNYFSSGLLVFNESHREFFESFKKLYLDNIDTFINLQDKTVRKGNEQTPLNYWAQMKNIDINLDLSHSFKLTHMQRNSWLSHNWQLNNDPTPFFIKYGNIWVFNGFPKDQRTQIMSQVWDAVKHLYK